MNKNELINYLTKLGLTQDEVAVYLGLLEKGEGTPLSISRLTGINRTKVYRLIEQMEKRKMLVQEIKDSTTCVSPAPIERVEELLKHKQLVITELSKSWNEAATMLDQMQASHQAETKVKYYKGNSGIEQMVWNVLKAKKDIVGYTFRDLSHFVGTKFMESFAEEFKRRNLKMRDIYSDEYLNSEPIDNNWAGKIDSRYLPSKILSIPHQMDIYDEVVTFYSWNGDEVWGTEIYNPKVAEMQRQLFELAWEKAEKI